MFKNMEELTSKWDEILEKLVEEYEIGNISFNTWLKPLEVFSIDDNVLYLLFSAETNKMSLDYISKKYELPLKVTIAEITGIEYEIKFILPKDAASIKSDSSSNIIDEDIYAQSNINPKYTFDTFVVGSNNRFAQNAALAVAESPGESYNPLYIYGGPGLGKTHLLHAIGNFILQENKNKKVLYVTSEEFTNEVIESIRNTNVSAKQKFRNKYRTVDILMIDDIQFIIGKDATQEEFFHTFNALDSAGKQIIISSDKPPKDMETLETRIRSRFEMGLMADIGHPDYETRMAILRKKMENEKNVDIPDDVLNYIAENIKSNVREIEGALNKMIACARLEKKEITVDVAKEELQSIISPDKPREITPQLIIEVVAEHYNLTVDQMVSKKRTNNISNPRQIAMYLCKRMTEYPLDAIGQFLGGRDHSTIIHGANKIENDYMNDEEIKNQIDAIIKKINPN